MANIEEKVESLVHQTIESLGYELYDVIYEKEAQDYYLRIFIDKPEGISLEDCEKVNDAITDMLDEADYIKEQYFLEVSSPGVERVLRKEKQLQANIGNEIICNLFSPIAIQEEQEEKQIEKKGKKKSEKQAKFKQLEGILKSFDENKVVLQIQLQNAELPVELEIEKKNIATMKLKYNWD